MTSCNVECAVLNLILWKEDPVEAVDNVRVAIRQYVQDVDMEILYLMRRNLIIFQNFKINSNPLGQ